VRPTCPSDGVAVAVESRQLPRQRNINLNPSEENDENNIAGYIDFAIAGRTSHLAVQHRLGLLPERRIGSGAADRGDISSNGPLVMSPSAGGTRDSP